VSDLNPYGAPAAPLDEPEAASELAKCPKCGARSATRVRYNWWGGALGPRLFHVVKCKQCRTQYNSRSGSTLTLVIVLYQLTFFVIFFGALLAYRALRER
jgi:hypothetical protein